MTKQYFKPSTARTHNLYCSDCDRPIVKGSKVLFKLKRTNKGIQMVSVWCEDCREGKEV